MSRPFLFTLLLAIASGACDKPLPEPAPETTAAAPAAAPVAPASRGSWPADMGEMLVVPADTDNTAILLYPESASQAVRLHLLASSGDTVNAGVAISGTDSLECGAAPVIRLASGTFGTWALGVAGAAALHSDSLETLAPRDSARLVAALARLASGIAVREDSRFTALPFTVLNARRFLRDSLAVVAAHLVRRLPQEAAPLEEHTLLVAERPLKGDSLVLRHSRRSEGTEETVEHFVVLGAVAAKGPMLLLVARDNVAGTTYELLERSPGGAWRVRWSRALAC